MKFVIEKNRLFGFLFIITILFDAYCFTTIGNRNITVFYPLSMLFILFTLLKPNGVIKGIMRNPFAVIMLIYMPLNYLIVGGELSTLAVSAYLWLLFILSGRNASEYEFKRIILLFRKAMDIMALYGIYQVIAYYFNLPLADLSISGYMAVGYNWGNSISIAGITLRRANAIFREPSFFSQFLAVNILCYIEEYIQNRVKAKNNNDIMWMLINLVALILTFSGTGILMLAVGFIILLILLNKTILWNFIQRHFILVLLLLLLVIGILIIPNQLNSYFFSRLAELDSTNVESISAYIRFIYPYVSTIEILKKYPIFGIGLGNTYSVSLSSSANLKGALAVALPRSFAELGIIGGLCYIFFMLKIIKKENMNVKYYKAILISTMLMTFMHGTWSSEVYWIFLALLNFNLKSST